MSIYYMNEAAFELPEAKFVDNTVTMLEFKAPSGAELRLTIQRFPLEDGKSLRDVVTSHVGQASRTLRAHAVLWNRDSEISGAAAIEVAARWRGSDYMVYTRQAHLAIEMIWLVIAGNAPLEEREICDEYLDRVLGTLRIRD
jgi:hypothetical protein